MYLVVVNSVEEDGSQGTQVVCVQEKVLLPQNSPTWSLAAAHTTIAGPSAQVQCVNDHHHRLFRDENGRLLVFSPQTIGQECPTH